MEGEGSHSEKEEFPFFKSEKKQEKVQTSVGVRRKDCHEFVTDKANLPCGRKGKRRKEIARGGGKKRRKTEPSSFRARLAVFLPQLKGKKRSGGEEEKRERN